MKKLFIGVAFALVCCVALTLTNTVNAATDEANYGTVSDITNVNTCHNGDKNIDCKITGENENITVTYNSADLKIIGADENGRPEGYAWVGIRIKTPTNATKYTVDDVEKNISDSQVDEYFGIDEKKLEEATKKGEDIVYTYNISWGAEDPETIKTSQTIKVVIKTAGITLYDIDDNEEEPLWNEEIYTEVKKAAEEANKPAEQKPATNKKEDKKDTTPKTGVVDYTVYVAITTAIVVLGGIFAVKKLVR